jgi:hypothetical protein
MILAAIVAGILYYQHTQTVKEQNLFQLLITEMGDGDIDKVSQFDARDLLNRQIQARCEALGYQDATKAESCTELFSNFKDDCAQRVFRLAPVEFVNSLELANYGKRYESCVLSKEYVSLFAKIENHFL